MKVSIIITAYNYGKYIERCLRSCLSQTLSSDQYEVVVVDDCSTDETERVMQNYEDHPQVRYIRNQTNLGVAGSANEGIRAARGQFIVRVDADDYVSSNFALFLSEYLQANHDAFCVSCDYTYVNNNEEKLERVYAEKKPVSCGIMYRKDLLIECGMYNSEWRHREEEELRRRLGDYYNIHHLQIPLYRYRMHNTNKTKQKDMMQEFKEKLETIQSISNPTINTEPTPSEQPLDDFVVAVIPARGGSQRLPRKNIHPVWGKPMLYWAINAAKKSKYVHQVYVSSEDDEILEVAKECGAKTIKRPLNLSEGQVYKQDVIVHATRVISDEDKKPSLVISLQANSPEVTSEELDQGIEHLMNFKRQEVMSVDEDLNQNASLRIMNYNAVFQRSLSTNFGVFVTKHTDVHTIEDVQKLEAQPVPEC